MITYQLACVLFLVYQGTASVVNNVCPTLDDYKTIFSNKNCSYNPDVGVTTVRKCFLFIFGIYQKISLKQFGLATGFTLRMVLYNKTKWSLLTLV